MDPEELIGEKYRLGPIIGAGGIATVRQATHVWTERQVAVKLLDPELPHFEQLRAGFLREARATVQLDHPNVVDVLDMGEDGWDTVYLVMELLEGPTLRDVLLERDKLTIDETIPILLPLLDALEKAHELGIVHRDFKPENIMLPLDAYGVVTPKLLDFGIAEVVRDARARGAADPAGVIMGTPHYMSPEQARDHRALIGPHTDVWGVAVVLYECLTGRAPFEGDDAESVLRAVCEAPIDFSDVPEEYVPILREALHRLPGFRLSSISELKARLEQLGFTRATTPPAPASLSSVPAPLPESEAPKRTLLGLGPDRSLPPTPSPIGTDADQELLPTKSNRKAWLAGVALAAAVTLAAWWTVRDPGSEPAPPSDAVIAQTPEAAAEPATVLDEVGVTGEVGPVVDSSDDTEAAFVEDLESEDVPAETMTSVEAEPALDLEDPAPAEEATAAVEAAASDDPTPTEESTAPVEATPAEEAATAEPVAPPTKTSPAVKKRKRRPPPSRPRAAPTKNAGGSQTPPDLVTEW